MNITFVKPIYTRGWFLAIVWVLVGLLVAIYFQFTGKIHYAALAVSALSAVMGVHKYLNGVRQIKVTDMTIAFYKRDMQMPYETIYFMHLQVLTDDHEVQVIVDAVNGEIITLKDIYWCDNWNELLKILRTMPARVREDNDELYGFPDEDIQSSPLGLIVDMIEQLNRIWVAIFSVLFLIFGKKGKRSEY